MVSVSMLALLDSEIEDMPAPGLVHSLLQKLKAQLSRLVDVHPDLDIHTGIHSPLWEYTSPLERCLEGCGGPAPRSPIPKLTTTPFAPRPSGIGSRRGEVSRISRVSDPLLQGQDHFMAIWRAPADHPVFSGG